MSGAVVDLDGLARRIDTAHAEACGAARTAIERAIECGRLLLDAKAALPHGQWRPWIEANLSFGERQAQNYMRAARHADELLAANARSTADLTLDRALRLLASPREKADHAEGPAAGPSRAKALPSSEEVSAWEAELDGLRAEVKELDARLDHADGVDDEVVAIHHRATAILGRLRELEVLALVKLNRGLG